MFDSSSLLYAQMPVNLKRIIHLFVTLQRIPLIEANQPALFMIGCRIHPDVHKIVESSIRWLKTIEIFNNFSIILEYLLTKANILSVCHFSQDE